MYIMKADLMDNTLTVYLEGRIDTEKATDLPLLRENASGMIRTAGQYGEK